MKMKDSSLKFLYVKWVLKIVSQSRYMAAGEPTVFNMTLQVLRREDGTMMKLTQYNVEQAKYDVQTSGIKGQS